MAFMTGRLTIVAESSDEFSTLLGQAVEQPNVDLVSADEQSLTMVVDLTGA